MSDQTEPMLPDIISKALALPVVRVDRRTFLSKLFPRATKVELMSILRDGPQTVYTLEQLTKTAHRVVMHDTKRPQQFLLLQAYDQILPLLPELVQLTSFNITGLPYAWPKRLLIFMVKKISSLKREPCLKKASVMS
ncbi:hypothetical protein [Bombilactobacillus apium]|uniref:hypothetical protein n=1 Tax=Bombilactobacillus apium TaxID=2675299 RepID=UPI001E55A7EF|nr:hypothetical protein [Bombilactobacillus apium]